MGCDIHLFVERKEGIEWDKCEWIGCGFPIPINRNYSLFSILANVRNNDKNPFYPIEDPRGLPDDLSDELKNVILKDRFCSKSDGHDHSWLTLKEILGFDWDSKITSGEGIHDYQVATYAECCREFVEKTIPMLKRLSYDDDYSDVRVVFWFDN